MAKALDVNLCLPGKLPRFTAEGRAQAQNASSCNEFGIGMAVSRRREQESRNRASAAKRSVGSPSLTSNARTLSRGAREFFNGDA
jgi:hypothetical protein